MRRLAPAAALAALTVALMALSCVQVLDRYHDLRSGWSWDLAYYNQWLWALTRGDGTISVRPLADYATEGPWIGKMNYLSPVRLLIAPVYGLWPDPRLLLIVHAVVVWLVVPAAYTLVRAETGSTPRALSAAALVPATPLLWPLVWNDFRELQMAMPFVLWAVQGWRGRNRTLTALGIGGMLACRQEYALVVATLVLVPPRVSEPAGRTYAWGRAVVVVGLSWFLLGFLGYLSLTSGPGAARAFFGQFGGPRAAPGETLRTAAELLGLGLGSWAVLAVLAPWTALLALPWVDTLASGKWALRLLGEGGWHLVRYVAPPTALVLAAGLLGYARLGSWLRARGHGPLVLGAVWLLLLAGFVPGNLAVQDRLALAPAPIPSGEVADFWRLAATIRPQEGVIAPYEVAAPLSSRRHLYSLARRENFPPGFPEIPREIHWVILRTADVERPDLGLKLFTDQGFTLVHRGRSLWYLRR